MCLLAYTDTNRARVTHVHIATQIRLSGRKTRFSTTNKRARLTLDPERFRSIPNLTASSPYIYLINKITLCKQNSKILHHKYQSSRCLCIFIATYSYFSSLYSYRCLCILIAMYSYCSSLYSYRCLCIVIVVYVFLDAATLTEVFPRL
jgi:hypothetical protein